MKDLVILLFMIVGLGIVIYGFCALNSSTQERMRIRELFWANNRTPEVIKYVHECSYHDNISWCKQQAYELFGGDNDEVGGWKK